MTAPAPARIKVLIVDDNADGADLLAEGLRQVGYTVAVALDGPSALGVAAGFRPEVAILDIGLPGMDGYELAERLHDLLGGRVRLIAITGYGQPSDLEDSRKAGFEKHFVKPVQLRAVLDALS